MSAILATLSSLGVGRRDAETWRVLNPAPRGEIRGIPTFRGRMVATNGILCLIERPAEPSVLGHFDSFIVDKDSPAPKPTALRSAKSTAHQVTLNAILKNLIQ